MPVPPSYVSLPPGCYFGSINNYSSFEPADQGGRSFHPAKMEAGNSEGGFYIINTSSWSVTDTADLAYMPYVASSGDWTQKGYSSSIRTSWFSKEDSDIVSYKVGNNFISITDSGGSYPLSLARKGYRICTSSITQKETTVNWDYRYNSDKIYLVYQNPEFWNSRAYASYNTTNVVMKVYLSPSGYRTEKNGAETPWRNSAGQTTTRYRIGVAAQAGGGAGFTGHWGADGSGGGGGAFWCGTLDLTRYNYVIIIEGYNAESYHRPGSSIYIIREEDDANSDFESISPRLDIGRGGGGDEAQKNNGVGGGQGGSVLAYGFRNFFSGTWDAFWSSITGGTVTSSAIDPYFISYAVYKGGNRGPLASGFGEGVTASPIRARTPDTVDIPIESMPMGVDVTSGDMPTAGGSALLGRGGESASHGGSGGDCGVGNAYADHRFGGGGGGGTWMGGAGGSGGYPYVCIGF